MFLMSDLRRAREDVLDRERVVPDTTIARAARRTGSSRTAHAHGRLTEVLDRHSSIIIRGGAECPRFSIELDTDRCRSMRQLCRSNRQPPAREPIEQ